MPCGWCCARGQYEQRSPDPHTNRAVERLRHRYVRRADSVQARRRTTQWDRRGADAGPGAEHLFSERACALWRAIGFLGVDPDLYPPVTSLPLCGVGIRADTSAWSVALRGGCVITSRYRHAIDSERSFLCRRLMELKIVTIVLHSLLRMQSTRALGQACIASDGGPRGRWVAR